jgi:hypothetical protein
MRKAAIAGDLRFFYSPVSTSADIKILAKSQSRRRGKRVNMDRTREPGKKQGEETSSRLVLALLPLLLGAFSLLGGCSAWQKITSPKAQAAADPLVGGDPAQKATATTTAPTRSKSSAVPALPASNSSASNAAMAIGEPLPGSRPLAIDDRAKNANAWQGSVPRPGAAAGTLTNGSSAGVGVQLQRPEAVVDPGHQPTPVPLPPASSLAATGVPSNDLLQVQLKQHGVTYQHQEPVAGGVKFSCAVPNRHNPNINHIYEATASDYAGAVRAVLQQIDAQQGVSQ